MSFENIKISIPNTSYSNYTIYHILITIDTKSYTLYKRYSDFYNLKIELENLYSIQIPYKFPQKSLFNTEKLIEYRRLSLENWLNEIINDKFDLKWKKSLQFKEFLNLKPTIFSSIEESNREKLDTVWQLTLDNNDTTLSQWDQLLKESQIDLNESKSLIYKSLDQSKKKLIIGRNKYNQLNKNLAKFNQLSNEQLKLRESLLSSLNKEIITIENLQSIDNKDLIKQSTRKIGSSIETSKTEKLNNQQLLQLQRQTFNQQDQDLKELNQIIIKQKELGISINNELIQQNELLNQLNEEVDHTDNKLHYANKRTDKFI
ncbi:hypothetical protein WICMUC_001050 [Wickerhamomyces mucosus]|uniref:PX domain-containing protein n=1 Tax=Wickerhamomyces mucosus TaxID=1378264 RepID=A0A9P8THU6_9ASCO|nr:hypothetical protein WICMUC_001050 [Wickerhamomyces mucosus]